MTKSDDRRSSQIQWLIRILLGIIGTLVLLAFQDTRSRVDAKIDRTEFETRMQAMDSKMKSMDDKLDTLIDMHLDNRGVVIKHWRK